jgi:hypothetical protein
MQKLPMEKITKLIGLVKGKKPVVIIISVVALVAGIYAVKQGYISEDLLNVEVIVNYVDAAFKTPVDTVSAPAVVDSVSNVVDSLTVN